MFMLRGPNGEEIKNNEVIVVRDKIHDCFRFVDAFGKAFYTTGFEDIKLYDILEVDKDTLIPFTGV